MTPTDAHWLKREWPGLLIVAIALIGVLLITVHVRRAAAMTSETSPRTEQQIVDDLTRDLAAWAAIVHHPVDHNQSYRRDACAVSIEFVASSCDQDERFAAQHDAACDVLSKYFPNWPCEACGQ